jgi:DtxR family Mn-dependent transcriptional regulator
METSSWGPDPLGEGAAKNAEPAWSSNPRSPEFDQSKFIFLFIKSRNLFRENLSLLLRVGILLRGRDGFARPRSPLPPMATPTTEDYLKQIWMLRESLASDCVPMGELAKALGLSPGTVTTMVKSIAAAGLADYRPRQGVGLTTEGEALALRMVRRHRIVELFLVETLGMDWSEVHAEAEVLEHAISDKVLERLAAFLGDPSSDPHGDPIPRSDGGFDAGRDATPLSQCAAGSSVIVVRVREQSREVLDFLADHGMKPGSSLEVVARNLGGGTVEVRGPDGRVVGISIDAAESVEVLPGLGR